MPYQGMNRLRIPPERVQDMQPPILLHEPS